MGQAHQPVKGIFTGGFQPACLIGSAAEDDVPDHLVSREPDADVLLVVSLPYQPEVPLVGDDDLAGLSEGMPAYEIPEISLRVLSDRSTFFFNNQAEVIDPLGIFIQGWLFRHEAFSRGCVVIQGEVVTEGPEPVLIVPGDDAAAQRVGDALFPALLEGALYVLVRGVGALGDGREGLAEGGIVEGVGTGVLRAAWVTISAKSAWWVCRHSGWSASGGRPAGRSVGRCRSGTGGSC